eukprot:Rhum_TRINITY_DN8128_c0_g2::Rhum_TRINITY_DN8128_c0_g2_i1::g.26432::m.26432/K00274/MAO, aofH; monoamine oxidase
MLSWAVLLAVATTSAAAASDTRQCSEGGRSQSTMSSEGGGSGGGGKDVFDVVVVGGGLSGVAAAEQLAAGAQRVLLLEAAAQLGGRLANSPEGVDSGAAWLWPGSNVMSVALARRLRLRLEPQAGAPGPAGGQVRVAQEEGGMRGLVVGLAELFEEKGGRVRVGTAVRAVRRLDADGGDGGRRLVEVETEGGERVLARAAVLALPPRVAKKSVEYAPALSGRKTAAMAATPTWMSKCSKVVLGYDERWWGSAHRVFGGGGGGGPAFQYYDASSSLGAAIVAFCQAPQLSSERLVEEVVRQTAAEFGKGALTPSHVHAERWSQNPRINDDPEDPRMHHLRPNAALSAPEWGGQLAFAGSEAADAHPGFVEGALESAEAAADAARRFLRSASGGPSSAA